MQGLLFWLASPRRSSCFFLTRSSLPGFEVAIPGSAYYPFLLKALRLVVVLPVNFQSHAVGPLHNFNGVGEAVEAGNILNTVGDTTKPESDCCARWLTESVRCVILFREVES